MSDLVKPKLVSFDAAPLDPAGPVGVVVPAHNAATSIAACVRSLLAQRGVTVDLAVVDDASTDQTATLAGEAGARMIRLAANRGPAAARNEGARQVAGNVVFFAEADGEYAPDHLLTCLRALSDPTIGASTALGVRAWTDRDNAVVRFGNALWAARHSLVAAGRRGAGAWCYRREVFERLGGFDERLRHGEDLELAGRVASLGLHVGVAGWSMLRHREPDGWRSWAEQALRKGRASAAAAPRSAGQTAKQLFKALALAAAPLGLLLGLAGSWRWLLAPLLVAGWLGARRAEDRFALRYLRRTRDWRTLAAAPALLWLRRFGLAIGGLSGGAAQSGSGTA